ncbi:protein translocase subunit SecD [bacterium]|nr:protein translocase subunit SecD [bacterium]MCI0605073.1 protein translocase subunit SecD [bacterium]
MKNVQWKLLMVLVLAVIAGYGIWPPKERIRLGLDLKGGIHLVAEVKIDEALAGYTDRFIEVLRKELQDKQIPFQNILRKTNTSFVVSGIAPDKQENLKKILENHGEWDLTLTGNEGLAALRQAVINAKAEEAVNLAIRIIRERVNRFGVAESVVQRQGLTGGRMIIQLPGVEDTERVKDLIKNTARLELRLVTAGPAPSAEALGPIPEGSEALTHSEVQQDGRSVTNYYAVQKQAIVSGEELQAANRTTDQYGRPAVNFTLTSSAGSKFGDFTEANRGKALAIVLDNKVQSAPTIQDKITTDGIITGQFTIEESNDLAVMLQSGALPAGIRFLEQRVVGPSLGLDSIRKGMLACAIGGGIIVLFMLLYYKFSGVNAVTALILNMLFLMALMSYFEATLTLPGIAGIVLSIGMAVDANVLIFERIKEDLRLGKTARSALQSGFAKAFWPIFDSNLTTIIAAVFLYWFGTGPVKGFAVTLIIGICCSMFTAIFVSRLLFDWLLSRRRKVESISI